MDDVDFILFLINSHGWDAGQHDQRWKHLMRLMLTTSGIHTFSHDKPLWHDEATLNRRRSGRHLS